MKNKRIDYRDVKASDFYDTQDPRGMSTREYDDYMRAKSTNNNYKRKFTLEQYVEMAKRFNQMSFYDKIKTIRDNSDILTLASDGNWWGVKVKDNYMQEILSDKEIIFNIENEWGSKEIHILIELLGIENIGM